MKTLAKISILLVFFIALGFTAKVDTKTEELNESKTEVYAVHDLELNPEVDTKEFEAFVIKEITPIYNKMKGQRLNLVKGDRGIRTGKYAIILTFESITDRDRIYPPSGGFVGDFGVDSMWEKFYSMTKGLDGTALTDYVKVD